jgi:hypothetical protein
MLSFVLRGVWRFQLPILATYALLRHQLLGIDVRLWGCDTATDTPSTAPRTTNNILESCFFIRLSPF